MSAFPALPASAKATARGRVSRSAPAKYDPLVEFTTILVKTGPVLVRSKEADARPGPDVMTVYEPSTSLGPPTTPAWPPAMTAEGASKIAEAPFAAGSATNRTTPPSTGSTGLLAVTTTASGAAKAAPMAAACGVLSDDGRRREALAFEGADVNGADARLAALVVG